MEREEIIVSYLDYLFNNKGSIHVMEYPLIKDLIDRYRGERFRGWYGNGQLRNEYYLVNRKKEGWIRGWHGNGQLWYECYLINGKPEGWDRGWYRSGQLYFESYHLRGKRKR